MEVNLEALEARIYSILDQKPIRPEQELLRLLARYWDAKNVQFGTKMEPWKASRIDDLQWTPPVLVFTIERHPGPWQRRQRWKYDFRTNEAILVSEWSPRKNPTYTKEQIREDAELIVRALVGGEPHPCLEMKGAQCVIWMGRLPQTKPVAFTIPQRTARARQARLKEAVVSLMEEQTGFERVREQDSPGSVVFKKAL